MTNKPTTTVIVIGAGVVGAATALALQKDGHKVTLIDREGPAAGASFGNAGAVVNGSCVPTALPGIVFDVLRMIGRPLSPLTVRATYLPELLRWLISFLGESRRDRVLRNSVHLHAVSSRAAAGWRTLTDNTPLSNLLRDVGWLKVYESTQTFAATEHARSLMDSLGTPYEILGQNDILDLEPELAPIFPHGIFQRDSLHIVNPGRMVHGLVDLFGDHGGQFRQFNASRIENTNTGITLHDATDNLTADKVVIAAGAWSKTLARQMGDDVPLEAERGYHLMLPTADNAALKRPVMNADKSFVLSPMETGLRLTSQVEFAGLAAAPDFRRVRSLLPLVERMLPGRLRLEEQSVWLGHRPSLPDSLPVLGFATRSNNVVYAFGHQHLGLTMGPASALIVADLIAGRQSAIDLAPYRANRFR